MDVARTAVVASTAEQKLQWLHPSAEIVWARAVEVFGNEEIAREWMKTPLPLLGNQSPMALTESNKAELQREVLTVLGRIDYGMYS